MNVWESIQEALANWGGTDCLLELGSRADVVHLSAHQLQNEVSLLAQQLSSWGIRRRHFVPLFLNNSIDFVRVFLALLKIGAVPLLAKMEYRRLELEEVFDNARPQAVVAETAHLSHLQPFLNERMIVVTRSETGISIAQSTESQPPQNDFPEEIASINYTYRGYGYPLGAMVSHAQYLHGAEILQDHLQGLRGEKMLVILPMAHIFTLISCILTPLLYGLTGAVANTLNPILLWDFIRGFRIDHITSVPEIYELLGRLRNPSVELPSLKVFISGGSTLTPEGYERIRSAFSTHVLHGYGLTEFTPVSGNFRGQVRNTTVGPVGRGVECRIATPTADGTGEILVRAPAITREYYHRPLESAEANLEGWLRTGDLGRLADGYLVFARELKQTRKINGNMVDLSEVTRALRMDPDLPEAEALWEENTLTARIPTCAKINFQDKVKELKVSLRRIMANYKVPKRFIQI